MLEVLTQRGKLGRDLQRQLRGRSRNLPNQLRGRLRSRKRGTTTRTPGFGRPCLCENPADRVPGPPRTTLTDCSATSSQNKVNSADVPAFVTVVATCVALLAAHAFGARSLRGLAGVCWWDTIGAIRPRQVADQIDASHARITPEAGQYGVPMAPSIASGMAGFNRRTARHPSLAPIGQGAPLRRTHELNCANVSELSSIIP